MTAQYEYTPVRLSHLFYYNAVGAIVRTTDYLVTPMDTRYWTDNQKNIAASLIPYVEQVQSALCIDQELRQPPVAKRLENGAVDGECLPAIRFPRWMRCPSCSLLYFKPWKLLPAGEKPRCQECPRTPVLEQVPWVMIHPEGYLADIPWHYLAHKEARQRKQSKCRYDWQFPYLEIRYDEKGANWVRCSRCKAEQRFRPEDRVPWGLAGQQPWIRSAPELAGRPGLLGIVRPVNDVRIHDTQTAVAIVLPPESRLRRGTPVDKLYCSSQKRQEIDNAKTALARKGVLRSIASDFQCSVQDIEKALQDIENGYPLYGQTFTPGILLEKEYQALREPIVDMKEDEDLVTHHHTSEWKRPERETEPQSRPSQVLKAIDKLVAVNRLRAIMVLKGFSRDRGTQVPPDIVGKSKWLPAIELYGEGVFFSFREDILCQWEKQAGFEPRTNRIQKRFQHSQLTFEHEIVVSPRFLFLHTLSHIVIRQLESQAGYPAASLKERIYCQTGKNPMAGILIYVAIPDICGSLGGLAELAEPKRFLALMTSAFDHADWCSLDPVCSEHEGQGPDLLNGAACHCCALIPETACSYKNVLLDRTFISGQTGCESGDVPGFLDFVKEVG